MFIKFGDDWHLRASTDISQNGTIFATTACGVREPWDQTFVDALPLGPEQACQKCVNPVTVAAPKPRRSTRRRR